VPLGVFRISVYAREKHGMPPIELQLTLSMWAPSALSFSSIRS
jgi:hypothetical protein